MDKTKSSLPAAIVVYAVIATLVSTMSFAIQAQRPVVPTAVLTRAPATSLPGLVDSNSPAVWDLVRGRLTLHVFTSGGQPHLSTGFSLDHLQDPSPVDIPMRPGEEGLWF